MPMGFQNSMLHYTCGSLEYTMCMHLSNFFSFFLLQIEFLFVSVGPVFCCFDVDGVNQLQMRCIVFTTRVLSLLGIPFVTFWAAYAHLD